MFKRIQLDHCYCEDKNFSFLKKLSKLGFILDSQVVEHPGKAFCKFIRLQSNNRRKKFYLEFVHVGKGGIEEHAPGLSFSYLENLEKFSKKIGDKINVLFTHKNYEWKKNSKDRLPGWNMLSFKKPPIKNLYTWFTEYELNPLWPKKSEKVTVHPNSVYSIHGIKLSLTEKSKSNLETILCRRLKKKTFLSDGTVLYLELGKKDKFQSIILNCKSIKTAAKFFKNYETTIFEGQNGIYVDNISVDRKVMWDIIVVQN